MKVQISNHSNGPVSFPQPILTTLPQGKSKIFVMTEQGYAALMGALAVQRLRRSNLISISVVPDEAPIATEPETAVWHDTGVNFPLGPDSSPEDATAMEGLVTTVVVGTPDFVPTTEQLEAVVATYNAGAEEPTEAPSEPAPLRGLTRDFVAIDDFQEFPASAPAGEDKKKRGRKKKS